MKQAWFAVLLVSSVAVGRSQTSPDDFDKLSRNATAVLETDPAQAVSLYKKALTLKPKWGEGWFYLGGALYRQKRYQEAIDAFQKGIPLSSDTGVAWAFIGLSEDALGKH